ncbi:ABC transporter substrate-binding protein [Pseudonocardia pini]|uniref:ABC transporter substrate-binding protein n=1 Tax=Pseudonocardia pini TaxID=2758030 RepID=UPI0015F0AD80|nr:ABC transporter substrate-binding protein [Pseudonocardia pini]
MISVSRRSFLVGVAAAGTLVACGRGASGGATAGGAVDPAAVLRGGWSTAPTNLDPHMATSEVIWFRFGLNLIYDRLFTVTSTGDVKGMLVTNHTYSPDGLTLTLDLREGVTFRDGRALDAAAVKTSLDRARTLQSPSVKARLVDIVDTTVTAPHQLTIALARPTPTVPYLLAECAGLILHPDLVANGDPATTTNGSGAYSVEEFVPGKSLTLVRDRADYWDPEAAQVARIENQAIPDFQAFSNALAASQIDIGQFQPNNVASIEGRRGLTTVPVPTGISIDLYLNRALAPLDSLPVRQAINLALDRDAITAALYPGSESKYQYYRDGLPGYDPSLAPLTRDLPRAKALLSEAGFPNGVDLGEIIVANAVTAGLPDVVQQQLAEAGIRARITVADAVQVVTRWAAGKDAAMLQFSVTGTEPSAGASTLWGPQLNPAGRTPEFTRLLDAAADNRLTPEERGAGYQRLNRYLRDQAWSAPITWITYPWVMTERMQGFSPQMDYASTLGPYDWRYLALTATS